MRRAEASPRRRAREAALQMLYQCEVGRASADDAVATYWPAHHADSDVAGSDREFANGLVHGTTGRVEEIDRLLASHARNWRVDRMAAIDRLVLRLAVYELLTDVDTPPKVVINEALELARTFSGDESVAFVNGVLDAVRKELGRE
jgi:transcription antitermination protein NusB